MVSILQVNREISHSLEITWEWDIPDGKKSHEMELKDHFSGAQVVSYGKSVIFMIGIYLFKTIH